MSGARTILATAEKRRDKSKTLNNLKITWQIIYIFGMHTLLGVEVSSDIARHCARFLLLYLDTKSCVNEIDDTIFGY